MSHTIQNRRLLSETRPRDAKKRPKIKIPPTPSPLFWGTESGLAAPKPLIIKRESRQAITYQ
jgi:hypothetical protein